MILPTDFNQFQVMSSDFHMIHAPCKCKAHKISRRGNDRQPATISRKHTEIAALTAPGRFQEWGYPKMVGLYWKKNIGDNWRYPHFGKPPYFYQHCGFCCKESLSLSLSLSLSPSIAIYACCIAG